MYHASVFAFILPLILHFSAVFSDPPPMQTTPQQIVLQPREKAKLVPHFKLLVKPKALHVVANIPEAIFTLRATKDANVWKGEGREHSFYELPAGTYLLNFSTTEPDYFIPPAEMRIYLNEKENKEIKATFQLAGKLTIKTNADRGHVSIQELGGKQKNYQGNIFERTKSFSLPEGRYLVTLTPPLNDAADLVQYFPPDPMEVNVRALNSEELNFTFRIENAKLKEAQKKLIVTSNLAASGFTLAKNEGGRAEELGHFSGKYTQLTLTPAVSYALIFDDVPSYQTPATITLEPAADNQKNVQVAYLPIQQTVVIPAGKAIIGDAASEQNINNLPAKVVSLSTYAIAIYEVTNAQYATWLNQALKVGKVTYVAEADNRGQVLDMQGRLLFKTFSADAYSQISAQIQNVDGPTFLSIPGKDLHPVINVSWYGAQAYCQENHCRLPTEAEWEKAAGMKQPKKGEPLEKYRFGFSQNSIDRTWANFKDSDANLQHFRVLTTPVGFYNGSNSLPLTSEHNTQQLTHLAKSPYGAFDMSGNVWEWVFDWYDEAYYAHMGDKDPQGPASGTLKVVKGGCYDSLADGVRVSERLGLTPEHADAYTGFRIAVDSM